MLVELAYQLPPLTEFQKKYAIKHLPNTYFKYRRKIYNGDTGEKEVNISKEVHVKTYGVHHGKCLERYYYTIVTTFRGIQVLRTLWVEKRCEIGEKAKYDFLDVYQNWIFPNGKRIIIGKRIKSMTYDYFDLSSPWAPKRPTYGGRFDFEGCYLMLFQRTTEYLKKRCVKKDNLIKDVTLETFFHLILSDNRIESMFKMGILTKYKIRNVRFFRQVVIARRHKYIPEDESIWFDYLKMLEELKKDTHNPVIICPKNLRVEHDKALRQINKKREIEWRKQQVELERKEFERLTIEKEEFNKRIQPFLNIVLEKDDITIRPLKTIEEFLEEGIAMNHCVFSGRYYKEENSLILSARDKENRRIETIEYDIVNNVVLQSRGEHNQDSAYHSVILDMMSHLKIHKNKKYEIV